MNKFFQFNEFVELGKIFKDCEAYLIALENFNRAIALSYLPINKERLVEAYDLRGTTKFLLKRYTEAIKDATKAIDLNPDEPNFFNLRGWVYYFLKNYDKAVEDATKAIDLNPDQSYYFNLRGWAYYDLKNYDKAVEDATKAIDLNPDEPFHFNLRGWAYYDLKNYDKAEEDATKAIDLNPDEPYFYDLRISVNSQISYEGYLEDIKIQDGLSKIKNYLNKADIYFEENRIIEAINYYEKVLTSKSEIRNLFQKDIMVRVNNRILEYKKMIKS